VKYILAYDLGTSAVKAVLVDTEGTVVCSAMEAYPLYTPRESWAEQEPEDYWSAVCASTKKAVHEAQIPPSAVIGMVFCSQWKGIIPLDADNHVLNRSIIWLDARASKEAAKLNRILQINYFKEKLFGFKPSSKLNAALGRNILCGADYWPKPMWYRDRMPGH